MRGAGSVTNPVIANGNARALTPGKFARGIPCHNPRVAPGKTPDKDLSNMSHSTTCFSIILPYSYLITVMLSVM